MDAAADGDEATVLVERGDDGVAVVTLNRPDALNSFTTAMLTRLATELGRLDTDPAVRALLLTGAGRAFSAGQDLKDPLMGGGSAPPEVGRILNEHWHPVIAALRRLGMPTVCAVNGVAAGASANMALGCDIVIAARSASFLEPFARIALIPDGGGTWLLPRLVGRARAMGMAMLAEPISAEQAADWGLIWQVVDDDALADTARALAARLAAGPTAAYARMREAIDAGAASDLAGQLAREARLQAELAAAADFQEGVAAFIAKRAPRFRGN